ncbi:MAG: diacylglycerol kinase family protein [Desulfobulbaceae bacterium]|nr:diacylglycerol kinase family protein [Desulfobulbaceae bacterium]
MRYFLVCNPGSRGGSSARQVKRIVASMQEAGVTFDWKATTSLENGRVLAANAARNGYDVIVAIGGDGTINQVLNGLYHPDGTKVSHAALGVIHTGTSPDFSKAHGIPTKPLQALKAVLHGRTTKVSIGRVVRAVSFSPDYEQRGVDDSALFQTSFFGCCVNIGMGAGVARAANSGVRKRLGDTVGTLLALLSTLATYRPMDLHVRRNGRREIIQNLYNLFIGKTEYVASGIKVNSDLKPDDQRFYNLAVTGLRLGKLPGCLRALYSGRPINNDSILNLSYGESIEVLGCRENSEIEFDGDPGGFLPCRIDTARDPLTLII